ncbi:hypothetical protein PanWU01x14_039730, partial [Parasponia andersonii]
KSRSYGRDLPRFACHQPGVGPDPNWTSYISNIAILDTRNSVKRLVCGNEAPLRSLFFAKRRSRARNWFTTLRVIVNNTLRIR